MENMLFTSSGGFTIDSCLPRICMMLTLVLVYLKIPYWTSLYAGTTGASQAFKDGLFAATQIVSSVSGRFSSSSKQQQSKERQEQSSNSSNPASASGATPGQASSGSGATEKTGTD